MKLRLPVFILAGICAAFSHLRAQATFTWIGFDPENNPAEPLLIVEPDFWKDGLLPPVDGTADVIFGDILGTQSSVLIDVPGGTIALHDITFNGSARPEYRFTGNGDNSYLKLDGNMTVGAGGDVVFLSGLQVLLGDGDHIINVASAVTVDAHATVSGSGKLVKTGTGTLIVHAFTVHEGGTIVKNGILKVDQATFGTAETDIVVGADAGDSGALTATNGSTIVSKNAVVGQLAGSIGSVTLNGSFADWTVSDTAYIGQAGIGSLLLESGSDLITQHAILGAATTGTGTVNITGGAQWTNFETLRIGDAGTGTLTVFSEGQAQAGDTFLGYSATGTGILLISQGGVFITSSTEMFVGKFGSGLLGVSENGRLEIGDGVGTLTLGFDADASGTLVIGSSSMGSTAGPGTLNLSLIKTGAGTGTLTFNTNTNSGSPYYLTKDGTSGGVPVTIDGNTQIFNSAGYNVLMAPAPGTFTGDTNIFGGTLAIGVSNALSATGSVSLLAPSDSTVTLDLKGFNQTIANLSLGGVDGSSFSQVDIGSSGTLTFTGTISFLAAGNPDGALITGGTLMLGGANIIDVGNSTNAGHDLSIASNIGGAGSGLIKRGTGTLVLSGTNSYTAGTFIENGILAPLADDSLPATRNITIRPSSGATATLQILNTTHSIGTLTLGGAGANASSQAAVSMGAEGQLALGENITFDATGNPLGATIAGGTLTFSSGLGITVADSTIAFYDLAISSNIAGSGGLTKSGPGALALLGANSYSGGTTINAGRLALGANNALPNGGDLVIGAVPAGTTQLVLNTYSQSIGALELRGGTATSAININVDTGGVLNLGGNLTYNTANNPAGASIVGAGTLNLGSSMHTFDIGNSSNGTFELTISTPISGTGGGFTKIGAGWLYLSANNSYTGPTILNGGTLYIASDNNLGTAPASATPGHLQFDGGTLYASANFTLNANRGISLGASNGTIYTDSGITLNYGGAMAGPGSLIKTGLGTLSLSGASSYAGATTINLGALSLTASNILPVNNSVVVNAGAAGSSATLQLNGTSQAIDALTFGGASNSVSSVNIGAGGVLTLASTLAYNASGDPSGATIMGGTLQLPGGIVNVGNSANTTSDLTIASTISGAGPGVAKTGAGTLVLAGSNNFSGGVAVNDGSLRLATNNTLNGQNVVVNKLISGSAILSVDGGTSQSFGTLTFGGAGANSGAFNLLTLGTGSTVNLGGNVSYDNTNNPLGASISNGTLALGATRTFAIQDSTGTVNELTISSVISGSGFGIVKNNGTGTLALTGANTYTGATSVFQGTLQIAMDSGLGTVPATATPGHLAIDGGTLQNTATMALDSKRGVDLGAGAGTFNIAAGTTLSYGGIIAGPGALIKGGTGTLTLAGASSYSGGTTLVNGKLTVAHPAALGSGTINFNGGELVVSPGITLSNTLNFTGSGGRVGGNGTFASAISAGPNVTLAPGTSPGLTTFTGALTWATGGSYDFEVMTANGSAGTGYDSINVTGSGSFAITANSGGKFNLNLLSLSNATTPGNVSDFLSSGTYSWQIASSVNPITGFSASAFNINTSGFTNSLGIGNFSVSINGANTAIFLNFSPIPEPSTYALMALGAGALLYTTRRRRRS